MNSFQYGMKLFQIRMNLFQIGMNSLYDRYSHTDSFQEYNEDQHVMFCYSANI